MAKNTHSKFRTLHNFRDYCDHEVNNEPSMTDPSQDESINDLVARMLRGELVGGTSVYYDSDKGVSQGEPTLAPQNVSGFDLADVPPVLERGEAAAAELKAPPASDPAAAAASPVKVEAPAQ